MVNQISRKAFEDVRSVRHTGPASATLRRQPCPLPTWIARQVI